MINIGRNEPCFCGSGKKFKKCCYGKDDPVDKRDEKLKILPIRRNIDYGVPLLNDEFFKCNQLHEISAANLLHMHLIAPEAVEACAGIVRSETNRHLVEAEKIKRICSSKELIKILHREPDPLNFALLRRKFFEYEEETAVLLLRQLKEFQDDMFVELAIDFLFATGKNYSREIIEIIENDQRDVYCVSLLCLLLGFYDHPKVSKTLWDYYHYFKTQIPHETYSDGPLLGLYEVDARQNERFMKRGKKRRD